MGISKGTASCLAFTANDSRDTVIHAGLTGTTAKSERHLSQRKRPACPFHMGSWMGLPCLCRSHRPPRPPSACSSPPVSPQMHCFRGWQLMTGSHHCTGRQRTVPTRLGCSCKRGCTKRGLLCSRQSPVQRSVLCSQRATPQLVEQQQ